MKIKKTKIKKTNSNQVDEEESIVNSLNTVEGGKQNKWNFKNTFNVNKMRSRLHEVYDKVSNLFDIVNLNRDQFIGGSGNGNMNLMKNGCKDAAAVSVGINNHLVSAGKYDNKTVKISTTSASGNITKISWPKTLEGLVEARKLFKGKKLTYHEKLLKRNLKNRVSKKRKKLEFQLKLAGKKGKKEGLIAEELHKTKRIKPVYNSEGKVIRSKYDFSEIGAKKDFCHKSIKDSKKGSLSNTVNESELKNDKIINADIERDRELFSKKSKNSTKQKEIKKKRIKNKLIENNSVTFTSENKQELITKKVKLSDQKSNRLCDKNESENKSVINSKFKHIFNKDNKIVFSKIELSDTNINKRLKKEYKDPQKLLQKLEMKKTKIDELKSSDKDKAIKLIEKEKWVTALRKASGEKVKDDPQLLKKTVMKEKNRKKKSKKKWDARIDAIKKKQQEKQKKRMENIMAKKKEKEKKKHKKAIKKGHYFP